jgi:hypothetical protein
MPADIDIDMPNRDALLQLIRHTPARLSSDHAQVRRHNSGVYVTDIPQDSVNQCAAIDYEMAEQRGYFKLDLLNMHVYDLVKDPEHYEAMLAMPPVWHRLAEEEFVAKVTHIGNHFDTLQRMPEPVDTVPRMAMFLAVIRPGKRHLVGKTWKQVAETVWDKTTEGYTFKKSHAIAYAHVVALHMNLLHTLDQHN